MPQEILGIPTSPIRRMGTITGRFPRRHFRLDRPLLVAT